MTNTALPAHIGIIMDGNGRWAKSRGQVRTAGHLEGLTAAKRVVKAASDMGISYLTLYTFSTENWKRAAEEVGFIMGLVKQYLRGELNFYRENRIRIRHAGDVAGLPTDIAEELRRACEDTGGFDGMQVILALNYGGRDEIVRAINRALAVNRALGAEKTAGLELSAEAGPGNEPAAPFTSDRIRQFLDNPDVPDPDLIIRTAGEFRTSNFLLWEGAYAEYYISGKFWPDWTGEDLVLAVQDYQNRDRRYGGIARV
ncbi:isoprenyl transferase [Spirochaetia bacterium]|nr:isoprenyl transferase [Spirochaetia bacterium]